MFKAVLFDMDGLMLDTEILMQRYWCEAANEMGFPMKPEDVLCIRSMSAPFATKHLKRKFGEDFDYYKVRNRRKELIAAHLESHGIPKKKGLDELLDRLAESDIRAAVCTASDFERTKDYLTKVGVFDKFDEFICGNMVEVGKPAPYIYLNACEKLGLAPQECIALEDSPNGVIAAATAQLNVIMIPDLTQPSADLTPLLYDCCESLDKVIPILFGEE